MMSDRIWQQFDNKIWDNNESLWSMTNFRWKDIGLRMKSKLIHWINDWYAWQQEHFLEFNLRGAFFRTQKYIPAVNFCKTVNLILEENIMDKNYKPITSMKEVPEQLRKLRRQYLRYQQAEIIYSISHKKLFKLASDAGAIYRIDGTVLIKQCSVVDHKMSNDTFTFLLENRACWLCVRSTFDKTCYIMRILFISFWI